MERHRPHSVALIQRETSASGTHEECALRPVGSIRSALRALGEAPRQGAEGAPDAWLTMDPRFTRGLRGIAAGDEIIVITWLHRVTVREISGTRPRIGPVEVIDGTPVVDVKAVLTDGGDAWVTSNRRIAVRAIRARVTIPA